MVEWDVITTVDYHFVSLLWLDHLVFASEQLSNSKEKILDKPLKLVMSEAKEVIKRIPNTFKEVQV